MPAGMEDEVQMIEQVRDLRLERIDFDARDRKFARFLGSLSGTEILWLHEEVIAQVDRRLRDGERRSHLMRLYSGAASSFGPDGTVDTKFFAHWCRGAEISLVFWGDPEQLHTLAGTFRNEGDYDTFSLDATTAHILLDDVLPIAYEDVSGELWPREIRTRHADEPRPIIFCEEARGSFDMGRATIRFWAGVGEAVGEINANEAWWAWWRSGPLRSLLILPGGRTGSRTYSPRKFRAKGRTLELGLVPNESALAGATDVEARNAGKDAVANLLTMVEERYAFRGQRPPLTAVPAPVPPDATGTNVYAGDAGGTASRG